MLTPTQTIWLDLTKAALTPLVAVVAVVIAHRQWLVARQKLILDLFDKRFSIFTDLDNALHSIMQNGKVGGEELSAIARTVVKSRFLFGRDIRNRLDRLWEDVVWQHNHCFRLEAEGDDYKASAAARNAEVFIAIHEWILNSDKWFAPYLRLDQRLP